MLCVPAVWQAVAPGTDSSSLSVSLCLSGGAGDSWVPGRHNMRQALAQGMLDMRVPSPLHSLCLPHSQSPFPLPHACDMEHAAHVVMGW